MAAITDYIEQATGYSPATVEKVLDGFQNFIELSLRKGEEVQLKNFGTFGFKDLAEREARNPRTQEIVIAPPKRKPTFKFSNNFIGGIQDGLSNVAVAADITPPPIPPELEAAAKGAKTSMTLWHIKDEKTNKYKPVPESELLQNGLGPNSLIWNPSLGGWKLAGDVPELAYLFVGGGK